MNIPSNSDAMSGRNLAAERAASMSRRRFLRGLGVCMALPALESFSPLKAFGAGEAAVPGRLAATAGGAPQRMAFVYFPNGAIPSYWWPKEGEGKDFALNRTMQPLEKLRDKIQIISGLDCKHATPGPDGAGDHARASGSFLTGVRVKKTAGADIHAGISIDQVAANQIGHLTRFPSLQLSCDAIRKSGSCDSGYSCAYQYNLSWRSPTTPLAPESNPRLLFERLFGAGKASERKANRELRQMQQRSVLDFVLDDARQVNSGLGNRDKQKLDEYLTSVREIEQRIQKSDQFKEVPDPGVEAPEGVPDDFKEHIRLMYEMMVLAFRTDSTRIATFLLQNEGSNRAFSEIGIPEGHHYLSHHRNNSEMIEKVAQIDAWYMTEFARFLEMLQNTQDVDGTSLLHNSMIVYGSGNADGNRHTHVNLPIVLAGGGGGTLNPGRYTKMDSVPATNLYLSLVDRLGVKGPDTFGDSTGRVATI